MNWLLIVVLAIVAIAAILGAYKGFLRLLFSLVAVVLLICLVGYAAPHVSTFIQTHTNIGARILQDVEALGDENGFIHMAGEIAHFHHENWDGTGYPEGVSEEQIPLSAQIVAVVSGYCALTEKRVYREAYSREEAIAMMETESGGKYNPEIFQILKKIVKQMQ